MSSMEMSSTVRWVVGSKALPDGIVSSPARKKLKKQTVDAAHSITWSCDRPWASHIPN